MSDHFAKASVVQVARAFLAGEICIIECAARLFSAAHSLVSDWATDPGFLFFGVLASDTDHLPYGSARLFWSTKALNLADAEIARVDQRCRQEALRLCSRLIERFTKV